MYIVVADRCHDSGLAQFPFGTVLPNQTPDRPYIELLGANREYPRVGGKQNSGPVYAPHGFVDLNESQEDYMFLSCHSASGNI